MPEKKEVTVSSKLGGVFSTGEFENERHESSISITYTENGEQIDPNSFQIESTIKNATLINRAIVEALSKDMAQRETSSNQKRIEKLYAKIRFRLIDGIKYPSVTSIINAVNPYKAKDHVTPERLKALASRGTVGDLMLENYIKTGKWIEPSEIPEAFKHLEIMKEQKVGMEGNLPAMVEKYKIKFVSGHKEVVNKKAKYAGEMDCEIEMDGKFYLADLKWFLPDTPGKVRAFKQMSAYAMASEKKYDGLCILPVNSTTKQGYSAPVVTTSIDKYFKMFLQDRQEFEQMFGV